MSIPIEERKKKSCFRERKCVCLSEEEREAERLGEEGKGGSQRCSSEKMAELRETGKRIRGGKRGERREINPFGHKSRPY